MEYDLTTQQAKKKNIVFFDKPNQKLTSTILKAEKSKTKTKTD